MTEPAVQDLIYIEDSDCPTAIEAFARVYLTDDLKCMVPDFHRELYQLAEDGHKRIVICAPRSFAKSTVFSKCYPLFQICEGTAKRIFIVSATGTLAEHWMSEIKKELEENAFLVKDYGRMRRKSSRWTQDFIECYRKDGSVCRVSAKGAGKQIRGFRPDIVIIDDIEEDEAVRSSDQRDKLKDWFNKALINTLEKESQLIMVGTMLHPLALLGDVMQRPSWVSRKYQAYLPDGRSLWPDKWPVLALREREAEIGKLAFNSEFMNDPIISENPIFVRENFKEFSHEDKKFKGLVKEGLYTVLAIDPAISKRENADYSAIVALSATFEAEPDYYVRECVRGHWPMHHQVEQLVEMYDRLKAKKIIVERVAYQAALVDELRRWCSDNRRFIPIHPVVPDKDKERRAHVVVPLVERGRVSFDPDDVMTCRLMDEMVVFPTGDHDDLVDAFVYALRDLSTWGGRKNVRIRSAIPAEAW